MRILATNSSPVLDANGNVSPKPNGPKDALSLGVGFSAVGATY